MKYATEKYITIEHPFRIGVRIHAIPTGKTRTTNGQREALCKVISPGANLAEVWIAPHHLVKDSV